MEEVLREISVTHGCETVYLVTDGSPNPWAKDVTIEQQERLLRWINQPLKIRINTIGAGDSLTAGVVVGLLRGHSLLDAARTGVAAAAADVTTLLPGTIDAEQVGALLPQVAVQASAR